MKVKKTRGEFLMMLERFGVLAELAGVKFAYAIAKNKATIQGEAELTKKSAEQGEDFKAYEKERIELNEKMAEKDADGKPVIKDGSYDVKNMSAFDKAFAALKKKHAPAIEAREKQIEQLEAFVAEEITLNLHAIRLKDIPEAITSAQMEIVEPFVEN